MYSGNEQSKNETKIISFKIASKKNKIFRKLKSTELVH